MWSSVFSPKSLVSPSVVITISIDKRLNNKFDVTGVLGKLTVHDFVSEPLAISWRNPFSGMNTTIDGNNLKKKYILEKIAITEI